MWPLALPGVGGPRDMEEAMEDVEVAGEGGLVGEGLLGPSVAMVTLPGFLIPTLADTRLRRVCRLTGSESVCVNGTI